ncbi:MAG: hypothetical protein R3C53_03015 [Pirellulaceae bacterium]
MDTMVLLRLNSILFLTLGLLTLVWGPRAASGQTQNELCQIEVVDAENGWAVPLVELRTTHNLRFVSDNAGVIALDEPELFDREVWFFVTGHGYEVPLDGFGYRGIRLKCERGGRLRVEVRRTAIAKRLGRLTGSGLFAESQKLGLRLDAQDAQRPPFPQDGLVVGCDSVQNAVYQGKMFWAWGDTTFANYPLGVFHMTSATTPLQPFAVLRPPLEPRLNYFVDDRGKPRGIAQMPGDGPTWLTGYTTLRDSSGREHLVASYRKIEGYLKTYEAGLCVWNDQLEQFDHLRTLWRKADGGKVPALASDGHPAFWTDADGQAWLLFGNPLPQVKLPATFEAWQDPAQWIALSPQQTLGTVTGAQVVPHSGSIAWSQFRKRWVTVFVEKSDELPVLGRVWYAEAETPLSDWGPAQEIVCHDNYTFYNPRLHPESTDAEQSSVLLFEGTYTAEFARHATPTPRYNYNQILYRLDLDDLK